MPEPPKHILVVSYSQTGQLNELTKHFLQPLKQQNVLIEEMPTSPIATLYVPMEIYTVF